MRTTPISKRYAKLIAENPGYLILIQLGDFYEAFNDSARSVSEVLGLSLTIKVNKPSEGETEEVVMCGFPYHVLRLNVRTLQEAGYNVFIAHADAEAERIEGRNVKAVEELRCPVCHHVLETPLPLTIAANWDEIKGNNHAKRACEIALTGLHRIAFLGREENGVAHFAEIMGGLAITGMLCACGYFDDPMKECTCTEEELDTARRLLVLKLRKADMIIEVLPPKARDVLNERPGEPWTDIIARVERGALAREAVKNELDHYAQSILENAITRLGFNPGQVRRTRAVAVTIAALDGRPSVGGEHIAEAIQYAMNANLGVIR